MYLVNALNVIDEVKKAVIGKDSCVEMVMMAILAGGQILISGLLGVDIDFGNLVASQA